MFKAVTDDVPFLLGGAEGRSDSGLPSGDSAISNPAGCSSASSDAVSPACARRAAMSAGLRGAADLERLGHGAEIRDQSAKTSRRRSPSPSRRARHQDRAIWRKPPPPRRGRARRSDASPCDAAARLRAPTARPTLRSRRYRRSASRRRSIRSPRLGRGSPAPARRSDDRRATRRRSPAHERRRR